jgi:hypothetical protein
MTHMPLLIIVDKVGTPHLRILTRCLTCSVTVIDRKIDASEIKELEAGSFGTAWGEGDGEEWLKHAGPDGPAEAFKEVAGEALQETQETLVRDMPNTWTQCSDSINWALGAFSAAVLRRLQGDTAAAKPERKPS